MSKIVVLSTIYLNIPSANGICARNLVSALREQGHEVYVVCYEKDTLKDEEDHRYIHTILEPNIKEQNSFIHKLMRTVSVAMGSIKPLIKESLTNAYYNALCDIDSAHSIDAVVGMYFPLESVEAICRFVKQKPEVKSIIYEVDSVGDGVAKSKLFSIYDRVYTKWLIQAYKEVTGIIVMNSHNDYWIKHFGNKFSKKMRLADIPVLIDSNKSTANDNSCVRMIYSGLIEKRYRSPIYLLSVLKVLSKIRRFEFCFFSKGDCEDQISKASEEIPGIKQFGYVAPLKLEQEMMTADILVNIGNTFSRSVPSKLISYMGYGKPIIHISAQNDDVCSEYLENYPLSLSLKQSDPISISVDKIEQFIIQTRGKQVRYRDLNKSYEANKPEYSARLISDIICSGKIETL